MDLPVVVIGSGLAGWSTVREFRKLDSTTPVRMITADQGDFYAKPSLSNAFAQGKLPAQLISTPAASMAHNLGVTLMPRTQVQAIDTAAQTVTTTAGLYAYRQLVLATGAQPIVVPVQGNAAQQVLRVNSWEDFAAFHAHLTQDQPSAASDRSALSTGPARHVLIMGAGLIGCEFANDLALAGYRVSVVDPGVRPLAALLPQAAGLALQAALEKLGVQFYWGRAVQAVDKQTLPDAPLSVTLDNGQVLGAACVLSAVGLRANTALAQAAGLAVDRGVLVNTFLQTTAPQVYALGDVAQYASAASALAPQGVTLPYVMPIMTAAKALASSLAGTPTDVVFPLMPVSIKTPALPLVVAPPRLGTPGQWTAPQDGLWQWLDEEGVQRGFALAGAQTAQRMAESKKVVL